MTTLLLAAVLALALLAAPTRWASVRYYRRGAHRKVWRL